MSGHRTAARTLTVLVIAAATQLAPGSRALAFEPAAESQFLTRINALRASVGVAPVTMDPQLTGVARDWSVKMSDGTGLAHNPNLRPIIDTITTVWRKLGENVAWGTGVAQLHEALVKSPHHYANLVDPDFRLVGIGVVMKGADMRVTEDFLTGATTGSTPAPRPPSTTTTTAAPSRATTTTAPRPVAVRSKPATVPPPAPVAAPVAVAAPPLPPRLPERVRVALATEQLFERAMRLPARAGASSRAR